MIINPFDKAKLEKKYPGAKYAEIAADYEAGKTYFCGYWHEAFTVREILENAPVFGKQYVCVWESGETTVHATRPDRKRDFEIVF